MQIGKWLWQNGIGISKIYLLCFKGYMYQHYGKSGQETNTKLFWKSVVWKFDIWDSSLVVFRVVSRGIKKIVTSPCDETRKIIITITSIRVSFCSFHAIYLMDEYNGDIILRKMTTNLINLRTTLWSCPYRHMVQM